MPAERLCLGCGVQSDERFDILPPQDRGKLVAATIRLMQLVLTNELQDATDDEKQLWLSLQPLVHNRDGYFLATLSAMLLSLLEGKTDCPISGVFGAGKTRAAAAIIAGLITVDPSSKIMILTKENVASQAFAEHIIALSLPTWIENKIGRLVGFMALHNQTTGTTKLDIPSAHRHEVIGSKQIQPGCPMDVGGESNPPRWKSAVRQLGWNCCPCPPATQLYRRVVGRPSANSRGPPQIGSRSEIPPETLATALSIKRKFYQGSTEHPTPGGGQIPYRHTQLSLISGSPADGPWSTPPAKFTRTFRESCKGAPGSTRYLATCYCSPHGAGSPMVGHT